MTRNTLSVLLGVALAGGAAAADPADQSLRFEKIVTLDDAKAVGPLTRAVEVDYRSLGLPRSAQFRQIMAILAKQSEIRHLKLSISNTKIDESLLDVLAEFPALQTLELTDSREWKSPRLFEQIASIKTLKEVRLSFMWRNPDEAACKAAMSRMELLESARFLRGTRYIESLNQFADELLDQRGSTNRHWVQPPNLSGPAGVAEADQPPA